MAAQLQQSIHAVSLGRDGAVLDVTAVAADNVAAGEGERRLAARLTGFIRSGPNFHEDLKAPGGRVLRIVNRVPEAGAGLFFVKEGDKTLRLGLVVAHQQAAEVLRTFGPLAPHHFPVFNPQFCDAVAGEEGPLSPGRIPLIVVAGTTHLLKAEDRADGLARAAASALLQFMATH
jgi:hypothetical protein